MYQNKFKQIMIWKEGISTNGCKVLGYQLQDVADRHKMFRDQRYNVTPVSDANVEKPAVLGYATNIKYKKPYLLADIHLWSEINTRDIVLRACIQAERMQINQHAHKLIRPKLHSVNLVEREYDAMNKNKNGNSVIFV